ncbi:hypothetical protein Syun_017987 [Stephania yunnanensis]|uniref:CAAX prenyl protease 2/Lysostaphin resistance protein A-like domain-containing protein n=1 Tax=Stephania yunnanensis TaxID=152371 RepID=A0AAP0NWL7_9MAGN
MSLIVSANLNIAKTLIPLRLHRFDHKFLRIQRRSVHRSVAFSITRKKSRVRLSNSTEEPLETSSEKVLGDKQLPIFEAWNVPWDWKICLFVMMPYLMSIFLTGVVESAGLGASSLPHFENPPSSPLSSDEAAIRLFLDELLKSVVKLSILFVLVSPYRPFPKDIFTYRWNQPFNLQKGWFLWGVGGLAVASSFVLLVKLFLSESSAVIQNEVDPLLRLLPLISASNASTAALTSLLGIMAPICEETIYRGFLMTSLTKWLPVNASIAISSLVFTLAHHSPGKSLEIFIFGVVLGLVYAQTRNLLAPITMHACWNLGVIFTLMYLQ